MKMYKQVYKRLCSIAAVTPYSWETGSLLSWYDPASKDSVMAAGLLFNCKRSKVTTDLVSLRLEIETVRNTLQQVKDNKDQGTTSEGPRRLTLQDLHKHFGTGEPPAKPPEEAITAYVAGNPDAVKQLALHTEQLFQLPYINKAASLRGLHIAVVESWRKTLQTKREQRIASLTTELNGLVNEELRLIDLADELEQQAWSCVQNMRACGDKGQSENFAVCVKEGASLLFNVNGVTKLFPVPSAITMFSYLLVITQTGPSNILFG